MRYYSDVCHKLFDSQEELDKAETALANKQDEEAKKKAERKADADKIQDAYDKIVNDLEAYNKLVDDFVAKYGSYHKTISKPIHFGNMLDSFWNIVSMM